MHTASIRVNRPVSRSPGYAVGVSRPVIYIIVPKGTVVLGAYSSKNAGEIHQRSVTGVEVKAIELHDQVPYEITEDVYMAEMEDFDEEVTPVDDAAPSERSRVSGDPER